jgi:hypothetical protein
LRAAASGLAWGRGWTCFTINRLGPFRSPRNLRRFPFMSRRTHRGRIAASSPRPSIPLSTSFVQVMLVLGAVSVDARAALDQLRIGSTDICWFSSRRIAVVSIGPSSLRGRNNSGPRRSTPITLGSSVQHAFSRSANATRIAKSTKDEGLGDLGR